MSTHPLRIRATLVGATVLAAAAATWSALPLTANGATVASEASTTTRAAPAATSAASSTRPNIVFVLTDDLSRNLVRYMPHVRAMERTGTRFSNYTVTDSLCCPSRSSIFTGQFPHDTGVFTNTGDDGGFPTFHRRGDDKDTYATRLHGAGYRTAMMGKFMNGYQPGGTVDGQPNYVPPGWDEWAVAGNGYKEFDYDLNHNGTIEHYGKAPKDYLTDVISAKGSAFVKASAAAKKPFAIELATFAPHAPYTPAPRDAGSFRGLKAPRGPAFNRLPTHAPSWLAGRKPLTKAQQAKIDMAFRKRVASVQAVDRMVGSMQRSVERAGVARNTVFVFSSDNGYHMGQRRLMPGKQSAFDNDVRVPLVITGPGVRRNTVVDEPAENIDLAPTFETLGGVRPPATVDGRSMTKLLAKGHSSAWRTRSLVEHHGPVRDPADPDYPAKGSGNPPTYNAMRSTYSTYVEYANGEREYYAHARDPYQLHNTAGQLSSTQRARLHRQLAALVACHGSAACWRAGGGS